MSQETRGVTVTGKDIASIIYLAAKRLGKPRPKKLKMTESKTFFASLNAGSTSIIAKGITEDTIPILHKASWCARGFTVPLTMYIYVERKPGLKKPLRKREAVKVAGNISRYLAEVVDMIWDYGDSEEFVATDGYIAAGTQFKLCPSRYLLVAMYPRIVFVAEMMTKG